MIRRASILAACALAGCAATAQPPAASLETQLVALRREQERQARQIETLESRVALAEDSARLARQALVGVGTHATIRIANDSGEARGDQIPSAFSPGASSGGDDDGAADTDATASRPLVRAAGREPIPTSPTPFVVRGDDRLPIAPVPPPPSMQSPTPAAPPPSRPARPSSGHSRDAGPQSALPAASEPSIDVPPATTAALPVAGLVTTSGSSTSSVRDPSAAPAYDQALAMARTGHCGDAVEALSSFLIRWPDHPFANNAMYWRGECLLSGGDVRRAAGEFEGLLARFPVGNKVPDALFKLVQCYRRLGDEPRAHTFASRLLQDYPRSDLAARLRAERIQ